MAEDAQPIERKLAAIFAADVAGYSRLMGQDEVGTMMALTGSSGEHTTKVVVSRCSGTPPPNTLKC